MDDSRCAILQDIATWIADYKEMREADMAKTKWWEYHWRMYYFGYLSALHALASYINDREVHARYNATLPCYQHTKEEDSSHDETR